jgi:hypothetical protein
MAKKKRATAHPEVVTFDLKALYSALDRARLAAGLSWRGAAVRIGVPMVFKIRLQTGRLSLENYGRLVAWLECGPGEFFRGYVKERKSQRAKRPRKRTRR